MLEVKGTDKNFGINFPTSIEEITPTYLNNLTENIGLPPHYCIIALCFPVRLLDLATEIKAKKAGNARVVLINAKISDKDSERVNSRVGQQIICDRSAIERGSHLHIATMISNKAVTGYMGEDHKLLNAIMKGNADGPSTGDEILDKVISHKMKDVVVVEFKIIAVNEIQSSIDNDILPIDPFRIKYTDKTATVN